MRTNLITVSLAALALSFAACSSTQPASDGKPEVKTHRVTGEVSSLLNTGLDNAYNAAVSAVKDDLQFTVESSTKDALIGVVKARTAQNKLVTVTLTKKSDSITGLAVSAGAFDSSIAKATADKIIARTN